MKKKLKALLFFIGWLLSPFTWWNDAFVNIPLSYLIANLLFYTTHLPFKWLIIGSYWFTNALGLFFMYFYGESLILSSNNKMKAAIYMVVSVIIFSAITTYLNKQGKLLPLGVFFEKYCISR